MDENTTELYLKTILPFLAVERRPEFSFPREFGSFFVVSFSLTRSWLFKMTLIDSGNETVDEGDCGYDAFLLNSSPVALG